MKTKTIITLLAVSVTFNIFFAIGYFKAKEYIKRSRTFEGRAEIMADKLNLNDEQKIVYLAFRKKSAEQRSLRRNENKAQYDKFWAEIIKDEPDPAVLEEFIQTASILNMRRNFVERMQSLMKILNPEQRELAGEIIRSRFQRAKKKPQAEAPKS